MNIQIVGYWFTVISYVAFTIILVMKKDILKDAFLTLGAVTIGLFYDNFIISIGSAIGEGQFLKVLNIGRYYIHAFITPLLVMVGYYIATGIKVLDKDDKRIKMTFWVLTFIGIGLGVFLDLKGLNLVSIWENELLRYYDPADKVAIPVIFVSMVLLLTSLFMLLKKKFWFVTIAIILMTIAMFLPENDLGSLTGQLAEVVFILLLTVAYIKIPQYRD